MGNRQEFSKPNLNQQPLETHTGRPSHGNRAWLLFWHYMQSLALPLSTDCEFLCEGEGRTGRDHGLCVDQGQCRTMGIGINCGVRAGVASPLLIRFLTLDKYLHLQPKFPELVNRVDGNYCAICSQSHSSLFCSALNADGDPSLQTPLSADLCWIWLVGSAGGRMAGWRNRSQMSSPSVCSCSLSGSSCMSPGLQLAADKPVTASAFITEVDSLALVMCPFLYVSSPEVAVSFFGSILSSLFIPVRLLNSPVTFVTDFLHEMLLFWNTKSVFCCRNQTVM